ncbi:unnamed protein product, partial [Owenia fusiformis]
EKPGKPGKPVIGEITDNSIALTWKAPEDDGGAEIFNYIIEYKPALEYKWCKANVDEMVPERAYTVTGLITNEDYEFRVTAENKAGTGPPSDSTDIVKCKAPLG